MVYVVEHVDDFLPGFLVIEFADFKLERSRELLPFAEAVDGTYVARLVKSG